MIVLILGHKYTEASVLVLRVSAPLFLTQRRKGAKAQRGMNATVPAYGQDVVARPAAPQATRLVPRVSRLVPLKHLTISTLRKPHVLRASLRRRLASQPGMRKPAHRFVTPHWLYILDSSLGTFYTWFDTTPKYAPA